MYTDLLGVNLTGVVQVPNAQNAALAQGCHEALRILGAMFRSCNKGAMFGLAVAEGVHRILSVHGHSDEGAYARDVMRAKEAGIPYGAVVCDMDPDNSIPSPQRSVSGFRAVYHSIALATAGAVALADPMVIHRGRDYPTVLVTDASAETDPGTDNTGDDDDSVDLTTQWAENSGAWAGNYARALNLIFCTAGGEAEVQRHLTAQANSLAGSVSRHMKCKVAVAFSWVEPTCSCPVGNSDFAAFNANHGPLATHRERRSMRALDGAAILTELSDSTRTSVQVDFRYLRRHGLFLHLVTHSRDGMANIMLSSGLVEDFMLVGGIGDLGARIKGGNPLSTFCWGRGLSSIPGCGELISLSQTNVFTFQHLRPFKHGSVKSSHLPRQTELIDSEVVCIASRLSGVAPIVPGKGAARNIARSRSRAAMALAMASDAGRSDVT